MTQQRFITLRIVLREARVHDPDALIAKVETALCADHLDDPSPHHDDHCIIEAVQSAVVDEDQLVREHMENYLLAAYDSLIERLERDFDVDSGIREIRRKVQARASAGVLDRLRAKGSGGDERPGSAAANRW